MKKEREREMKSDGERDFSIPVIWEFVTSICEIVQLDFSVMFRFSI